jgi:hypothetical protein
MFGAAGYNASVAESVISLEEHEQMLKNLKAAATDEQK